VVETPIGPLAIQGAVAPGDEILLGFRPECLSIMENSSEAGRNTMKAKLMSSTFVGDQFIYDVTVREKALVGKSRVMSSKGNGELNLYVDPADIMVSPATERAGVGDYSISLSGGS
jgi:hypothetical protein